MRAYCYRFFVPARLIALILTVACLAPAAAHAQGGHQKRPTLRDEQTTGADHFLIHYTFTGDHAVSDADADGNGTSDFVESVAAALELSWQKEVVDMGWAAPPGDQGIGGDDRIDVYLENNMADDIAGYTESGDGQVGDNPNTPETETSAAFSYLSIDHEFAGVSQQKDGETPHQLMQVTVAHEFNHVLQAGYDSSDPQTWLYEATAVWMEGQVYPDVTDRRAYLPDLLEHPERCLAARKQWYGSWLYLEYLSEQYGPDVVRSIWEQSRGGDGYQAIDDALTPFGATLIGASRDFALANLLRAYQAGKEYPTVHLDGEINGGGTFAPTDQVQSLGASYIRLVGGNTVSVEFAGKQSLSARLVGIHAGQADVFDFVDGRVEVDLGQYEEVYVVIHGDDLAASERRCFPADYAVTVGRPAGPRSSAEATWPSPNFTSLSSAQDGGPAPSSVHQPYHGNTSETSAAQSPEDLKPGFITIIPAPPDGYYFDYAYVMTRKDLGSSAPFYIPDSEKSANYDFLNAADQWLSVSETPTHYATLLDWEAAIQYQPAADPQTINGVEVLVENSSGGKRSQVTATFINQGLFIVVDGDGSRDDVLAMTLAVLEKDQGVTPSSQDGTQVGAPVLDAPTAVSTEFYPSGDFPAPNVMVLAATLACGLGICLAGVGVVAVVFVMRRNAAR